MSIPLPAIALGIRSAYKTIALVDSARLLRERTFLVGARAGESTSAIAGDRPWFGIACASSAARKTHLAVVIDSPDDEVRHQDEQARLESPCAKASRDAIAAHHR